MTIAFQRYNGSEWVTESESGETGSSNHASLTNLDWLNSKHTGVASSFAGLDGDGDATNYLENAYSLIDGTRAFTGVVSGITPTADTHLSTKKYVDDNAFSGIPQSEPVTGNLLLGTNAGANIAAGGNYNLLIGEQAGEALTTGDNNVAIGFQASHVNNANNNFSIGYQAMLNNIGGVGHVALGYKSLYSNISNNYNTAIGYQSLYNTKANYNVGIGYTAGFGLTSGYGTVAIGHEAVYSCQTNWGNVGIGYKALRNVKGNANVAFGYLTGFACTTAQYNVFIGIQSGRLNTTGDNNTCIGFESGYSNTTNSSNVNIGYQAGYYETAGNKLFIDNTKRTNEADARIKALVYGIFDPLTANQYYTVNGHFTALESITCNDYTLPLADGNANDVIVTDGAGTTSWAAPAAGGGGSVSDTLMLMGA